MNIHRGVLDWLRRLFMVLVVAFEAIGYTAGFHTKSVEWIGDLAVIVLVGWFGLVLYSDIMKEKQIEV